MMSARQVFWLTDRPQKGKPSQQDIPASGRRYAAPSRVPAYSGGSATDSHRVPRCRLEKLASQAAGVNARRAKPRASCAQEMVEGGAPETRGTEKEHGRNNSSRVLHSLTAGFTHPGTNKEHVANTLATVWEQVANISPAAGRHLRRDRPPLASPRPLRPDLRFSP